MHLFGSDLVLTATDLSGFLACGHLTTLELGRARGELERPYFDDPGKEVLRARGQHHEREVLEGYRARGLRVVMPRQPEWEEGTAGWTALAKETIDLMAEGVDVIAQGGFFDGRWLGRPDFLIKVDEAIGNLGCLYEVLDAKLSRSAKVGAVLQIAAYSKLLSRTQSPPPALMHLALGGPKENGDARLESFATWHFDAYHRSVERRLLEHIETEPETYPEPCEHCRICDWQSVCDRRWREDDHLSLVAGITRKQRAALEARGVATLERLGELPMPPEPPLESVSAAAFEKIREQARIQLEGRREKRPKYELLLTTDERIGLRGLPEPSPGDLFFDIEADPHAFTDGLEYLLGYADALGTFTPFWALTPAEERARFEQFMDMVVERLERWPGLHIYHYAAYEETALKRLAARYATREQALDRLLRGGVLVDLYRIVRQGVRASVESYSIKKLEPLYGFERAVDLRAASSALANFEAWLQLGSADGADELLRDIEAYNRDDCLSTLRLRDWLEGRRPELERMLQEAGVIEGPLTRPAPPDPNASDKVQEEDEVTRALMDGLTSGVPENRMERSDEEQARWMLAHLLSWHRREEKSFWWEYFHYLDMDDDELLQDPTPLAGLECVGEVERIKKSIVHRYSFPPQEFKISLGRKSHDPRTQDGAGDVVAIDDDARTIDIKRGVRSEVPHPRALIPYEKYDSGVMRDRIRELAQDVIEHGLDGAQNRAAVDLLLRRPPRVGQQPGAYLSEHGESGLAAARRLAVRLDRTVLPIQGPPGTGKTYVGARMILSLIAAGKRVGVTATSHKVITNLLEEVGRAADEERVLFRGIQKPGEDAGCAHRLIECADSNPAVDEALGAETVDLVAGTVWLWARPEMAAKVDVLFVDEAGQISLANVLAACAAARSIVLIGDPRQLEQPQKGVHPPGADVAALQHLVGPYTLERDRGLFLEETRRLHPELRAFTSSLFYDGQLKSRYGLERQRVDAPPPFDGAGLRFVPVAHSGNTSESPEEVDVVAKLIDRLFRAEPMWVGADEDEVRKPLRPQDVLVVAPYNAQVTALRERLPPGIRIGTVDKFQGQEAPIVVYSTATSTAADAPRGMSFLFSPNRLNVATSRARCLVVWVGSPALLGPDCRTVAQVMLANGFCRFGEMAGSQSARRSE